MEEKRKEKEEAEHRKKFVCIRSEWGVTVAEWGGSCVVSPQLTWL
jgi:hypothetical protein